METHRPVLVYLLAASHSGSTLTAMLLNAHSEILSVGELKATNLGDTTEYLCSCQSKIRSCRFWERVSVAMQNYNQDFHVYESLTSLRAIQSRYVQRLLRPLHRGRMLEFVRDVLLQFSSVWRRELPLWQKRNRDLVQSVSNLSACRFVVDSSKIGIRLKYLFQDEDIRIKVIRIVRDGRAVALTYMDPDQFADASVPSMRGGGTGRACDHRLSMKRAATEWRRSNEEAEAVIASLPSPDVLQVSYEDLCMSTSKTLDSIHQFLGVSHSENHKSFKSVVHHVIGNGMRLDQSSKVVLDERWREILSKDELTDFEKYAGDLNKKYGY